MRGFSYSGVQSNGSRFSYFINIISSGTLGIASRIELLITTRSAGYTTQTRVLSLPMASASDAEFKEYLTLKFEKMKVSAPSTRTSAIEGAVPTFQKEKDQLRRSASFLESQLRREKARSREVLLLYALATRCRWLTEPFCRWKTKTIGFEKS